MTQNRDIAAVRERYAAERARRLRDDGLDQFAYIDARDEPGAERIDREPLRDEVDAIVLGAGLGGLTTAVRLRQAGLERVRLVERGGDVGGTWYWNRYPAAQCDIESYIYLPLLEETGTVPTLKYAYQPEILAHCQALAEKFGLYEHACFRTEVRDLSWDEASRTWTVRTDHGDEMRATYVVVAGGFFQRPKLPAVPGFEEFRGKIFHTSRWDYAYTGGEPGPDGGGLPNLADKRVGVVGTGATALQCISPVARAARSLHVFQRTPTAVFERNNRPTDAAWARGLAPGWQADRINTFTRILGGHPIDDPIADKWTEEFAKVALAHGKGLYGGPAERAAAEIADIDAMERVHRRIDSIVDDPATAESLKPRFRMLCKRPSFHDEYLATFNRDNVTLVDTRGRGIERVTADGVLVDGVEHELDCLILATGFDTRAMLTALDLDLTGRDGVRLSDHWAKSMRTFHGFFSHGFPNCFFIGLTQTAAAVNFAHTIVEQADHVGYVVSAMRERGAEVVETTAEAEQEWVTTVQGAAPPAHTEFLRACTPGYYNNEGKIDDPHRFGSTNYAAGAVAFYGQLRQWRDDGALDGLTLR